MADLATARRAEATDFTDRIGREVIVQHEVLVRQAVQAVDHLLRVAGAQRRGRDRLGLAAREQRRTVRTRQEVYFRLDRTDLGGRATVDAAAVLQDRGADDLGFQLLDQLGGDQLLLRRAVGHGGLRLGARLAQRGLALLLVGQLVGRGDVLADQLLQLGLDRLLVVADLQLPRVLRGLLGQVDDRVDDLLRCLVREHDGAQHHFLGQLLGFRLDHHHRVVRGGDDQVQVTGQRLGVGRVQLILAIDITDARRADRAHEGHARDGERGRRGDQRQDVRLVLAVIGQHLADAVDLVIETFGEQRADRTIDQAADQRLTLGRTALALEKTAGDTARRRELLLIVNGQREEVLPFLHILRGRHGAQHHRLAQRRDHRAVGLTGHLAGFEGQRLAAPLDGHFLGIEHGISFTPTGLSRRGLWVEPRLALEVDRIADPPVLPAQFDGFHDIRALGRRILARIRSAGCSIHQPIKKGHPVRDALFRGVSPWLTCAGRAWRSAPDSGRHPCDADSRAASGAC